jgi:hypothetical protein
MKSYAAVKSDPQALLSESLRKNWIVLPRFAGIQLFVVGSLFGAGLAVSVVGTALRESVMRLAFPASLVVMWALAILLRRRERQLVRELESRE